MSKFFVSAPAKLHASLVEEASQINWDVSYTYSPNKEGSVVEREVYNLLSLLQTEEVFLAPSQVEKDKEYLSYLDTSLKVDVLAKVGKFYLCWQIKSSTEGAKKHLALDKVTFKGKSFSAPGLIVLDSWEEGKLGWKLQALSEISQISGIPVRNSVVSSINKWKKLRKLKVLPSSMITPKEGVILTTLGLIQIQGKEVKFM